jgi:polysaccharide chain length determinant protein (PEP-CTERM system associated)
VLAKVFPQREQLGTDEALPPGALTLQDDMIRNGEITFSEAKRIFRNYWWILPIAVVGCGLLGLLAATVLPKRYTSETLVLVDQPTVPTEFVKPVVTEDLNHRLASMQEQILSRTRLQPIIEKFGLYAAQRQRINIDDLVENLRSAVTVKPMDPMPGTQNRSLPGFYVDVTFDNPQTAQQICTEITSMFMQQNTREREQQAVQTTSFLSAQLEEAKRKLDDQDQRLASFKRQYLGSLPEEEQTNLNLLTGMNSQLEANVQALSRAQQDKTFNQSLLTQQEASAAIMAPLGQSNTETPEQQLNAMEDQLASLQARYTPEHPDVVKTKNQIEEFKKRMAAASKVSDKALETVPKVESFQVQQLRARLRQDDLNIADLTKRQGQIQEQITQLQGRLQASPVVEQQLKEITRNYQTALDFYNDLLKKREQSAMATDLEHQQESEQFRVLDPPSLPADPSFPKRSYFAGGGLGAGLALAFGIMYLIALLDKSMHSERDVELCLNLPVLTTVPLLEATDSSKSGLLGDQALQASGAD